ncbi:MAG: hypothetical protein F4076_08750 [Acidimicrobiaceae bacterium]|nr:hypothetical protein [Acidimicrobiaceae bacterium]MYE75769.1 hypothetical protein [Acidimicrobiaceae bacterium]MYH44775.1 hypothetical protein [Acidimicrobiaceae bacterium]MYJ42514.1 hypothetical protein [Acidimicrobiaceae bacterium]MYJ82553.1 hypothetical protein [Acidimicrobiaceae bacterium]
MFIRSSARKHGVRDEDMRHALRHHWKQIETDDVARTVFIGPSTTGEPLEIVVVYDEARTVIIHAMVARRKYLEA